MSNKYMFYIEESEPYMFYTKESYNGNHARTDSTKLYYFWFVNGDNPFQASVKLDEYFSTNHDIFNYEEIAHKLNVTQIEYEYVIKDFTTISIIDSPTLDMAKKEALDFLKKEREAALLRKLIYRRNQLVMLIKRKEDEIVDTLQNALRISQKRDILMAELDSIDETLKDEFGFK